MNCLILINNHLCLKWIKILPCCAFSSNIALKLVVKFWIVFTDFPYAMIHKSYRCCCVVCKIDLGDVISIHIQQEYREILMFRYLEVVENHLWRWYPKTYNKRVENDFQSTWDILASKCSSIRVVIIDMTPLKLIYRVKLNKHNVEFMYH